MERNSKVRPIITLFIQETYGTYYQISLISGVVDAARRCDANLLLVCGSELNNPRYYFRHANVLYDWIRADNVDGVILALPLFNYVDQEFQQRFCKGLQPLPLVGLGRIENVSSNVVVDNTTGLRDVIRHLVEQHGYRRLAFVRGPAHNVDAEERYAVYREALAEYSLPFDADLVTEGNFLYMAGEEAVRILWNERQVRADAIIAANDDMALGVLGALRARGVKVPEQVAVTGFDDSDGAWATTPSLTTVRQPIYQQAYKGVELLLAQIRGETIPETLVLPTEPVYRRSCGCFSPAIQQMITSEDISVKREDGTLRGLLSGGKEWQDILLAVSRSTSELSQPIAEQCGTLMRAFLADLQSGDSGRVTSAFLLALENGVRETAANEQSMDWHTLISLMRKWLLPVLQQDPLRNKAEALWQAGHALVSERLQQKWAINSVRREIEDNSFRWITQDLVTTFDEDALMDVLAGILPTLGIPECYVAVYEDPQNVAGPTRLILMYEAGKRIKLKRGGRKFPSPQSLVRDLISTEKPRILVMESLHFRDERLGFVAFGLGASLQQVNLHNALRESISGGLKGARLVHEVERRNTELEKAYQALRDNQQKLLTVEKMASLGRLTAGIAHEMNTPLAAVRAALAEIEQLVKEYKASIGDSGVTAEDHAEIADDFHSAVELADKAAERAAGFVRSIKSQTRDMEPQERQPLNAVTALEDALLLLAHALKQGKCTLDFKTSSRNIPLVGAPGRLEQVVTNLVNNAIEASEPQGGSIIIKLSQQADFVELQVSDHGCGILPEHLTKIYDPMFTTKPFGHNTGLGLTIVHDIVTGEFGGSIDVVSQVGQGATFTIHIPLGEKI